MKMTQHLLNSATTIILIHPSEMILDDTWDHFDAKGKKLHNLANPTDNSDTANKVYVNHKSSSGGGDPSLTKDLEIKNRKFINVGFLSDRSDASDKRYVDTNTNNILSAHETFHGDINMNNHHIKNSHAPTSNNNAANKIIL